MEVVITSGRAQIATLAADAVERLLIEKPDAVLGLATGSSPTYVYDELVRRYEVGRISFAGSRVRSNSCTTGRHCSSRSSSSPLPIGWSR